jgi:hypothetical protein
MKLTWILLVSAAAMLAQPVPVAEQKARITGGGGTGGKCTGEVDVDDVVEIQIFSDMGRMQSLGGQPAAWKRLDCTSAMPGSPAGFRFRGVDGRGKQSLVRDPNDGLGVAVIRIEDTQRGRGNYSFDIEWGGGTNSSSTNSSPDNTRGDGGFGQNASNGGFGSQSNTGYGNASAAGTADFAYGVHACQSGVVARGVQNGYTNVQLWSATLRDNAGNNDVVTGEATATPSRGGAQVRVQYQCTVDAATGRVVDLQIR